MLPTDSDERKTYPLYSGLFAYFPAALAAIAHHSYVNNEKHNPGEPLYWNRAKSADEADALLRHLMEGDYVGTAWRALALLQKHLEAGARRWHRARQHPRTPSSSRLIRSCKR